MIIPFPTINIPVGFEVPDRGTAINALVIANKLELKASYRCISPLNHHEVFVMGDRQKVATFKVELEKICPREPA